MADEICGLIADGHSLRSICEREDMPDKATVLRWRNAMPEFSDQYARAREAQADTLFEEILEIADTTERGEKHTTKANGDIETVEADMIEHRRLRVDARKWIVARMAPKKYGDRLTTEHTGADGGPIQTEDVSVLTPVERKQRLAALLGSATGDRKITGATPDEPG